MINAIAKRLLPDRLKAYLKKNYFLLKEIEWAHIYHDSIRDKDFIKNLSLNVGRMAGNYTFFYLLNKILAEYKPKSIVEFGLGESSKMIAAYLNHYLTASTHCIVEHDPEWISHFVKTHTLSERSKIIQLNTETTTIQKHTTTAYAQFDKITSAKYDLYVVDGPIGTPHYSRPNIIAVAEQMSAEDAFIILMDDTQRIGEQETLAMLIQTLTDKKIEWYSTYYEGAKRVSLVVSRQYKYLITA